MYARFLIGEAAVSEIKNRAYMDLYAFYVPYRLLWREFPDFLINGEGTMPTVTDLWQSNYEKGFTQGTESVGENTPWLRYAYNLVVNKFFNLDPGTERAIDANTNAEYYRRPSNFHTSTIFNTDNVPDTEIDTSGASVSVMDVREAFHEDEYKQMRNMYGSRYTDYLVQAGVKANWSILEEPELIGMKRGTMKFAQTNGTYTAGPVPDPTNLDSASVIGQPSGYWRSSGSFALKRTFAPEHGLVIIIGGTQIDMYQSNALHPLLAQTDTKDYWTAERSMIGRSNYKAVLFNNAPATIPQDPQIPSEQYNNLRRGVSQTPYNANEVVDSTRAYIMLQDDTSRTEYMRTNADSVDPFMSGLMGAMPGEEKQTHLSCTMVHNLTKQSPLPPSNSDVLR